MNADPLAALWQAEAPRLDPARLAREAAREAAAQRRLVHAVLALGLLALAATAWADWRGILRPRGLSTTAALAALLWQARVTLLARRRLPAVATLAPEALLLHRIAQARTSLRNGRILYGAVPAGLALGLALAATGVPLAPAAPPMSPAAAWAIIGASAAAVAVLVAAGLRTASRARADLAALVPRAAPPADT